MSKKQKFVLIAFSFFQGMFLTGVILLTLFELKFLPSIHEKNAQIKLLNEMVIESTSNNHSHKNDEMRHKMQVTNI